MTCGYSDGMDINKAIKKAGSISALARLLGVTRQAVQGYVLRGLPQDRAKQLRQMGRGEWAHTKGGPRWPKRQG